MTHYDTLQVAPTASPEIIQAAYKALAKQYHPDLYQGDKDYAKHKMQQINEAYRVLSSSTLRNEYDNLLKYQTQQQNFQTQKDHQQKTPPKKTFSIWDKIKPILIVLIVLCVPIGLMIMDDAGVFDSEPKESPPANVIIPRTGEVLQGKEYYNESEITVTAPHSESCIVKLKTASGVTRLSFYVRAGDTVTVGVPSEYLYVYFASGKNWYGLSKLFGEKTNYSMDDEICDFTQYTWEYTLTPMSDGNFSEKIIDAEDFN